MSIVVANKSVPALKTATDCAEFRVRRSQEQEAATKNTKLHKKGVTKSLCFLVSVVKTLTHFRIQKYDPTRLAVRRSSTDSIVSPN